MLAKATKQQSAFRSLSVRVACSYTFFAMVLLSCFPFSSGQSIKATVLSSTLRPTPLSQWSRELHYKQSDLYPLTLDTLGCPFIDIDIDGVKVPLMLDSGTSRGFVITTHAPAVPHQVGERHEELNADGSHRGEAFGIFVKTISVLGRTFKNVNGTLADWRMFSSEPFNGSVGLDYFLDRRVTVDYHSRRVACTPTALPNKLNRKHFVVVDLVEPPRSQGHILYVRARVNRREAIIYFDTGYNVSFIDPAFTEGIGRLERPGRFSVFRKAVPIELGGQTFILDELREETIRRGTNFDFPVALVLGSDILSRFILTIDIRSKKMLIALAE